MSYFKTSVVRDRLVAEDRMPVSSLTIEQQDDRKEKSTKCSYALMHTASDKNTKSIGDKG